jgi:hypothetical protein
MGNSNATTGKAIRPERLAKANAKFKQFFAQSIKGFPKNELKQRKTTDPSDNRRIAAIKNEHGSQRKPCYFMTHKNGKRPVSKQIIDLLSKKYLLSFFSTN